MSSVVDDATKMKMDEIEREQNGDGFIGFMDG